MTANTTYEIFQPSLHTTLGRISIPLSDGGLRSISVAAAYITDSGLRELTNALDNKSVREKAGIAKRWITSFDYCRTSPRALSELLSMPGSEVRIYNPVQVLKHKGIPKQPFHPKAFLFQSRTQKYALTGSGNISRSGLRTGVEAGILLSSAIGCSSSAGSSMYAIKSLTKAFNATWSTSVLLDDDLLGQYMELYSSVPNTTNPVPTADDLASGDSTRGALSADDLKRLRVCKYLWIEAGNITKNLGKNVPGNQLMMKRMTRVFFGFPPDDLPRDSAIGSIQISYDGGDYHTHSLTYSNNGMDKLTLPRPGTIGPVNYDQKNLLFEKTGTNSFKLSLGSNAMKGKWNKRSKKFDGCLSFSSGRKWGVFQ